MFWGLILEPNKRYTQTVEKAFHLSMASLDVYKANNELVQVMIVYNDRTFLLCTLQKGSIWQVPLDLNFQEGTKIAFTSNGGSRVHLTGYLIPEDGLDELDDFEQDEEDEEYDEDEDIPTLKKINDKKRKAKNSPKENNGLKRAKKSKVDEDDDEDNDDDESDIENGDGSLEFEDDSDDVDDNTDDLDEDEDDEDDDEDEDEDEEQEETPVKQSKKQKQQNQQNNQTQQNKKDKIKVVNGTKPETHPEKAQGNQKKNKENKKEEKPEQKKRTVEGGVQLEDIKVGEGAPAKSGRFVSVYYVGRLQNGKKFDQTQQGDGFKFRLGKGEVIKGWDVGIVGMKVGGKRRIVIPPNMAYGAKGSPPVIPPNSSLNFEVELKSIH